MPRNTEVETHAPVTFPQIAALSAAADAVAAEERRRLHPATAQALTEAGFCRYFVPRRWGGSEGGFPELVAAVTAVAVADASAAWCGALWATHSRFAAYLPERGQHDLWSRSPDVRIAAAVNPAGTAAPRGDGWVLSGEWQCVSGAHFAEWALLAVTLPTPEGPAPWLCAVPAADFAVRDSWDSTGLRGTGSHTVVVEHAVVPAHRAFPLAELLRGAGGPGRSRCHSVPALLVSGPVFCATALGAARHALEVWAAWAAARGRSGRDPGGLHRTLTRSAGDIEAAQLLLQSAAVRAETGVVTERTVASNQRDAAAAAHLLVKGVERLFRAAGVHACGDSELQRCWRDVHTVAAHRALNADAAAAAYASAVLAEADAAREVSLAGA
ncbi:oxidoreductase [Streptomyces mashuensis]|nr:oxidoreductase [Streptomyces mashuensis]